MDYLDILRNDAKLAEDFDTLFDFRLLDALEERDTAEGRCTFSLPGMAFALSTLLSSVSGKRRVENNEEEIRYLFRYSLTCTLDWCDHRLQFSHWYGLSYLLSKVKGN